MNTERKENQDAIDAQVRRRAVFIESAFSTLEQKVNQAHSSRICSFVRDPIERPRVLDELEKTLSEKDEAVPELLQRLRKLSPTKKRVLPEFNPLLASENFLLPKGPLSRFNGRKNEPWDEWLGSPSALFSPSSAQDEGHQTTQEENWDLKPGVEEPQRPKLEELELLLSSHQSQIEGCDPEESTVGSSDYFGSGARSKFYEHVKEVSRTKDKYTQAELSIQDKCESESPASSTPRSTFIQELLFDSEHASMPRSIMVIRKNHCTEINLAHQGVGDRLGLALARALPGLPELDRLNIEDNRLTDVSIAPILRAIDTMHHLVALNLGGNKMDEDSAAALAHLLKNPESGLVELSLCKADIDDTECVALAQYLSTNNTLTSLDLSHNLIGEGEVINIVNPDFDTGAEAFAELLSSGSQLKYLNLSWNKIRKDSARQLGEALEHNEYLTELDLSFNAFGDTGGQAVGTALLSNKHLKRLNLESNAIPTRAAFTIATFLKYNPSLVELNLRGNPVGQVGGRALMQLPIECGEHLQLHIERCFLTLSDPKIFIDPITKLARETGDRQGSFVLDLSVPYRRALGMEALRVAAEQPGFTVLLCEVNGQAVALERKVQERMCEANDVIKLLEDAFNNISSFWLKYDADQSGTVDQFELAVLLKDLNLDDSQRSVENIMKTYDVDDSGLLEQPELEEFIQNELRDVHQKTKPRTIMALWGTDVEYILPREGTARLCFGFRPERDLIPRTTTSVELKMMLKIINKTENQIAALHMSLGHLRLQVEQAQELVKSLQRNVRDVVKALAMVLPFMAGPQHAQALVGLYLRNDYTNRRRLEAELGPAFRPIMGFATGFYSLNLSKEEDRLALVKIAETNNLESRRNRSQKGRGDTSQRGDWNNYRNERFDGSPFEIKKNFFEDLPDHGELSFDYVSTQRPSSSVSVTSSRRFLSLFKLLDWVTDDSEKAVQVLERELDRYRKLDGRMWRNEYLHEYDHYLSVLREDNDVISQPAVQDSNAKPRSSMGDVALVKRLMHRKIKKHRSVVAVEEVLMSLRDMICTRWFDCAQVIWVIQNCPLQYSGGGFIPNWKVRILCDFMSRIVDLRNVQTIFAVFSARERAESVHRLGLLNLYSPCYPDSAYALDLRRREDRIVAKMLVHLSVIEPGENVVNETFQWSRTEEPVPGWELPVTWFREDGMPLKGRFMLEYFSGQKGQWADELLRTALMSLVLADPSEESQMTFQKKIGCSASEFIAESLVNDCDPSIVWKYEVNNYPPAP